MRLSAAARLAKRLGSPTREQMTPVANPGATALLRSSPLFKTLPTGTIEKIVGLGFNRAFETHHVLFRQGDPGLALYGIIAGEITVSTSSTDGQVLRLNTQGPGEICGEIALLDGGVRTATASITQPSTLFVLEREPFLRLLEDEPKLTIQLLALACERIRWTSRLLEESAFMSVPERLASRLTWLRDTVGTEVPEGVKIQISQANLAQYLSVSRQVVNGYLQEWQHQGHISLSRGAVVIHDASGLGAVR